MAALSSSSKPGDETLIRRLNNLVIQLQQDFTSVKFQKANKDYWSARTQTVFYNPALPYKQAVFGLLHELAHSQLDHQKYKTDFELLRMEAAAWKLAEKIGQNYGIAIDDSYMQKCLDSYRDWLYMRSHCPSCSSQGNQIDSKTYRCLNCSIQWKITANRFSRPYRKLRRT